MDDVHETTILQEGPVKVTNLRTVIRTINYPISQIKSVNATSRARNMKPLLLTIPGILFIAWSIIEQTAQFMEFFNFGIVLIVVSIALVLVAKPTYAVQIGSSSGNSSILRSTDQSFIQRIVDAMNKAMARRE
jgi:hypothetical protein